MREFSKIEKLRLSTLHPNLQDLVCHVNMITPIFILCGLRTGEDQEMAVASGHSKVHWPFSRHNRSILLKEDHISDAVDICPYPIDWDNMKEFHALYNVVMRTASILGIKLRAGADFNMDGDLTNDKFIDAPHYELI